MSSKNDISYPCGSVSTSTASPDVPAEEATDPEETVTIAGTASSSAVAAETAAAASGDDDGDTIAQSVADDSGLGSQTISLSGTSASEAQAEEARRQSLHSLPGAFRVRTRAAVEAEEAAARQAMWNDAVDEELHTEDTAAHHDPTTTAVLDAHVEAVAVQIDEAMSTYQAVPVVDALSASRIAADGGDNDNDEVSYQLQSGASASLEEGDISQRRESGSTSAGSSGAVTASRSAKSGSQCSGMKKMYVIWGLAALLLLAVAIGLRVGLSNPQGDATAADNPIETNQDTSYRLVEMDISPQIEYSIKPVSSSVSLGLMVPTAVAGVMSRSLLVGRDRNGGMVKVYRSQMKKDEEKASFGPFEELVSISLSDVSDENDAGDSSVDIGSAIIVDTPVDGESFAVSHRDRVRMYSSPLHEAKRLAIIEKGGYGDSFRDKFLNSSVLPPSDPESALSSATAAANRTETPDLWHQRGPTLVGIDDPAIRGFGSSIGFSATGRHSLQRVVVGSDSGHVRVYRLKYLNGTVPVWQRLDGGLLNPEPDSSSGTAVVAMAGGGLRFVVGYPSLGKVSLYQFIDEENLDENSSRPNFELIDEIYSKGNEGNMFGQSLSVDVFANFLVVGAKGYVRAYWLRVLPSSNSGFEYVAAGDKIVGEESDGEEFGSVVASGRVPLHKSGCLACPFILDQQRIAISSPAYGNGRGRVLLYQYNEDEGSWQPLVSPIEGEKAGDELGHDVRFSPDMGSVVTSSSFGEVRMFRLQALQNKQ